MNSETLKKKYENEFSEFLIKRIGNAGGSLQLQHITGHMSQLDLEVRNTIGTSVSDLRKFLKNHTNLFLVDNNVVSLVNSPTLSYSGYDSDSSSVKSHSNLPLIIRKGKGVIIKIFRDYGFIKSKEPIKTEIFFNSLSFGDTNIDLVSFLYIGNVVYFNAKLESSNEFRSKYRANKVWKADESNFDDNVIIQKSRKNRETGLYDPISLESEGIIQTIFPNLGFIAVKGDDNNTVFFHKNHVVNYDNIIDLTKILSKGEKVEFNAHRSTKPDSKARWEATKVWKISGKMKHNESKSDSSQNSKKSPLPNQTMADIKTKDREMKKDQRGKICPRSHGAVIKFGENELADGDSAVYYVSGSQVTEISWEFNEGDDVCFDAVKIKSAPGWKALLVWIGKKPDVILPTCLGDFSEFTDEEENGEISSTKYTSKSSSYMSESSSSSLKSVSITSESNSLRAKYAVKEKTPDLSDIIVSKKIKGCNKKAYKVSNASSQDSLYSLPELKNPKQPKKKDRKEAFMSNKYADIVSSKAVQNWADSPYPADEAYESIVETKSSKSDVTAAETVHNSTYNITEDETEGVSGYASSFEEEKVDIINEVLEKSEMKKDTDVSKNNNVKHPASIKRFCDVKGEVIKVYSKFAQIRSCNLQNTISFFWNDFYSDEMSVEELELDDLKQILKVGDIIHFNYFIIIDDLGQNWQKVTMAWSGSRPKNSTEITPEDFIKQNNLSVTISSEFDIVQVEENKPSHRKFLTSFVDVIPDDHIDKVSRSESYSEDESLTFCQQTKVLQESKTIPNFKNLSSTICQILKKNIGFLNSEVDFKSVSEEIVNVILESCSVKKCSDESYNALSLEKDNVVETSDNMCSRCRRDNLHHEVINMKDCEVQTIVTGDIIAQSIFTEC